MQISQTEIQIVLYMYIILKFRYLMSNADIRISIRDTCILNANIQHSAELDIALIEMQISTLCSKIERPVFHTPISAFHLEIPLFQLQISAFQLKIYVILKNTDICIYQKRYLYLKSRYLH